jgi:hypothetical protein
MDRPVRLGSMLFTMVEPHKGHEVAYNRFYERDHFYAGVMVGPHAFSGQRFVATHDLKALRYPDGPNPVTDDQQLGSLLSVYWVEEGGHDAWNRWSVDAWHALDAAGRIDVRRDRVHSALYRHELAVLRDPEGPAPEQALDHRYPGMAAVFYEADDRDDLAGWLEQEHLPTRIAADQDVIAQVLGFSVLPLLDSAPADAPSLHERFARSILTLWFLDVPAAEAWPALSALPDVVAASGRGRVTWMSPFLPTIPGTDTYMDQL